MMFEHKFGWYCSKIRSKISKKGFEVMSQYYRRGGAIIGKNCVICSDLKCELFLLEFGNNVCISTGVTFVTHDHSYYHVNPGNGDLFGKIKIGDNCFIGENAVILYGVELADNIIVAAGSVVTKSFMAPGIIVGGNPAKKIGTCEDFKNKNVGRKFANRNDLLNSAKTGDARFVKRRNG